MDKRKTKSTLPAPAQVPHRCYVYQIIVDGVIRYIGKGKNGRVYAHLIDATRTANTRGINLDTVGPFFRQQLVRAVKRGSVIKEKIVSADLTDKEAYQLEYEMIGKLHKNRAGQLWNTIDERWMHSKFLPAEWSNPIETMYRLPRPLKEVIDHSTGRALPIFLGQVPLARRPNILGMYTASPSSA